MMNRYCAKCGLLYDREDGPCGGCDLVDKIAVLEKQLSAHGRAHKDCFIYDDGDTIHGINWTNIQNFDYLPGQGDIESRLNIFMVDTNWARVINDEETIQRFLEWVGYGD